jgi:hypothetical protein
LRFVSQFDFPLPFFGKRYFDVMDVLPIFVKESPSLSSVVPADPVFAKAGASPCLKIVFVHSFC